jgi:hypothetical protein
MPKLDFKKVIRDRIRTLKQFERFMDDPATAPIIEQMLGAGGIDGIPAIKTPKLPFEETQRGALTEAVKTACLSNEPGVEFISKNIIDRLLYQNFKFTAKDKAVAVNAVLKRLVERGVIEQIQEAAGKRPAKYQVPKRFPRTGDAKGNAA